MNYLFKIIPILVIMISLFSCGKSDVKKDNEIIVSDESPDKPSNIGVIRVSKEQFKSENMKLATAQMHSFPVKIRATGMIDVPPNNKAVISAFAGGYIKNTPFLIGDLVKKGQVLVTIENMDFVELQQEYLEVSEQLNYLKTEYERQDELYQEKISSKKSFLKAESEYKKTNAIYFGLRKKLQLLNINPSSVENGNLSSISVIYAPIGGSITKVNVSTGVYVSPADRIMEIVNTDHIHLELKVFEKDVLKLKKGQKVNIKIPESSMKTFQGEIHLIGKSIDENRTVEVHAHVDNESEHNFIVGMFVETDILIEDNESLAIQEEAIIDANNKNYVLILKSEDEENYNFIKKEIELGSVSDDFIGIKNTNQFKNTDRFLLGGFNLISDDE